VNFRKYILILLTLVLLSVGCTSTNFAKISTNEYLPKSESVVLPVFSGDSDQMYERIGVVFVYGGDSLTKEQINDSLRDQAGKVGADAIIFAKYKDIEPSGYFESFGSAFVDFDWAKKHGTGSWLMKGEPAGAGLAISYKDNLNTKKEVD